MAVKGINCVTACVSELQRSRRFYADVLGWVLVTDEPDVAGLSFGDSYLVIHTDTRPGADRPYAGGMHVLVQVENADAEHTRLRALGVNVTDLVNQPWGQRTFTFTDPDGYTWMYGQ